MPYTADEREGNWSLNAWRVGVALDLLHVPGAIAVLALGWLWMPERLHLTVCTTILALQAVCLGCPLMVLTGWLRRQRYPRYAVTGSLTEHVYRTYGRTWGLLLCAGLLAVLVIGVRLAQG